MSTLTYSDGRETKGTISPGYHLYTSEEDLVIHCILILSCCNEKWLYTRKPIESQFLEYHLGTNVDKNGMFVEKGHTGDFSHWCGAGLSKIHISRVIINQVGV